MRNLDAIREARRAIEATHYPNVTGTVIGYKVVKGKRTKQIGVTVYVKRKVPEKLLRPLDVIPKKIGSVPTDVVRAEFRALELVDDGRPVTPGYSVGHPAVTAGTLSFFAKRNGEMCLVTNAHVGANTNRGELGDPIYYPGPYDGGTKKNTIGHLVAAIPIEMLLSNCPIANAWVNSGNFLARLFRRKSRIPSPIREVTNQVDCCCDRLIPDLEIDEVVPSVGAPTGIVEAELGMKVKKTSRTTEHTQGEVTGIEGNVQVSYGDQGIAMFTDQITSDIPSAGGDSGAAVFEDGPDGKLVGLLFAGGEGITVMNRMQTVFDELGLSLDFD